jgi:WD40 repeat protein
MSRMTKRTQRSKLTDASEPTVASVSGYPSVLAWSHRGDILAVAEDSGDVELFFASPESRQRVRAHAGPVQSLAWNPRRDAFVTTGQDGSARLWESPFSTSIELLPPGDVWADHACWSPRGDRIALAVGSRAHVFAGGPLAITEAVASTIAALAFTPSGKSLGVACYGGVRLFDPSTGRPTRSLDWRGSMISIAFSPDGSVVACGCQDNSVHFWRIASGKDAQMSGYPAKPRSLAFNHDGTWLATSGDTAVSLWPFDRKGPEGRAPVQLDGHPDVVTELAYAPLVDLLVTGSKDGMIALWAPPKLRAPVLVASLSSKITHVAWGADGERKVLRWAAADASGGVMIGSV